MPGVVALGWQQPPTVTVSRLSSTTVPSTSTSNTRSTLVSAHPGPVNSSPNNSVISYVAGGRFVPSAQSIVSNAYWYRVNSTSSTVFVTSTLIVYARPSQMPPGSAAHMPGNSMPVCAGPARLYASTKVGAASIEASVVTAGASSPGPA